MFAAVGFISLEVGSLWGSNNDNNFDFDSRRRQFFGGNCIESRKMDDCVCVCVCVFFLCVCVWFCLLGFCFIGFCLLGFCFLGFCFGGFCLLGYLSVCVWEEDDYLRIEMKDGSLEVSQ